MKNQSQTNCTSTKRDKGSSICTDEVENKKIASQQKQNNSEALKCLFEMARQSKNNKSIVGKPSIPAKNGNINMSVEEKI